MQNILVRSGTGDGDLVDTIEEEAHKLLLPCLEAAHIVAAEYARACDRDVILSQDFELGLKFAARRVLGRQTETFFPELEAEDSADSVLSVDESTVEWTRYEGADERLREVNALAESWADWVPQTPIEEALKRSIDSTCAFSPK
jgi:hypothetical protein